MSGDIHVGTRPRSGVGWRRRAGRFTGMTSFFDRLEAARRERHTTLCVGIDPRLERLPDEIRRDAGDDVEALLTRFGLEVLDLVGRPRGVREAPDRVLRGARPGRSAGLRGRPRRGPTAGHPRDRGREAGRHRIHGLRLRGLPSPARGRPRGRRHHGQPVPRGGRPPALRRAAAAESGKGIYVLVRTSNPGARDLQELHLREDGRLPLRGDRGSGGLAGRRPRQRRDGSLGRRGRRGRHRARGRRGACAPACRRRRSSCRATARRAPRPGTSPPPIATTAAASSSTPRAASPSPRRSPGAGGRPSSRPRSVARAELYDASVPA